MRYGKIAAAIAHTKRIKPFPLFTPVPPSLCPSLPPPFLPFFQELSHHFGAKVAPGEKREYGKAMVSRAKVGREGGREGGREVGQVKPIE